MSELTNIIIGLQRLGDAVQTRGDDLRYVQQQQTYDHVGWIDQQLDIVEKVRSVLLQERKKFMPVDERRRLEEKQDSMPKVVQKGPV